MVAFLGRASELGHRVVHGSTLGLLERFEVSPDFGLLGLLVSPLHVEPGLRGRAQHRGELIAKVTPAKERVAGVQIACVVFAERARDREGRALRVEVRCNLLMQQIERRLLVEE